MTGEHIKYEIAKLYNELENAQKNNNTKVYNEIKEKINLLEELLYDKEKKDIEMEIKDNDKYQGR